MSLPPNPVTFDGTNDYCLRGGGFTGAADTSNATISLWYRLAIANGSVTLNVFVGTSANFWCYVSSGENFTIVLKDSAAVTKFSITFPYKRNTDWHHVMVSTNGTTGHAYLDGVSATPTVVSGNIDWTLSEWAIGATTAGANKYKGDLADVWIDDIYIDLSQAANREKFLSASGYPVDLGSDGSTPTGSAPLVFFSGATDSWHTNKGTGGGFTEYGALTDGTVPLPAGAVNHDPLVAAVGHFTMTGYPAGLTAHRELGAAVGHFAMTGYAAGFTAHRELGAAVGHFTMTGYATGFTAHRELGAAVGHFAMTGYPAGLVAHRELGAAVGHFAMTGYDAGLTYTPVEAGYDPLVAVVAHFIMTGYPAGLSVGRKLPAEVGHFTMTGYATGLRAGRKLSAGAGSFDMTGYPAGLYRGVVLPVEVGHFLMTGYDAGLSYTPVSGSHDPLVTAVAHFVMTGYPAGLRVSRKLTAAIGHFIMTGYATGLDYQRRLLALPGHFVMTGHTAGLTYTGGSLPLNWHSDLLPLNYVPSPAAPADPLVLAEEFRNIQTVLDHYAIIALQVADREPRTKLRGMLRWAISPWDPLSTGAWPYLVYWNGFEWLAL